MAHQYEAIQDWDGPDFEFMSEEVADVLKALHLNSLVMGDYLVIVNGVADITYLGEPYLALQFAPGARCWSRERDGRASHILCR